jgi:hypothetical protein
LGNRFETFHGSAVNVILFSGELPSGTTSRTSAAIDEHGDLVIETQDVGDLPLQAKGDLDYEWWVTVRAPQKDRLLQELRTKRLRPVRLHLALWGSRIRRTSRDELLLLVVEQAFGGRASAASDLRRWLDERKIPYGFSDY